LLTGMLRWCSLFRMQSARAALCFFLGIRLKTGVPDCSGGRIYGLTTRAAALRQLAHAKHVSDEGAALA